MLKVEGVVHHKPTAFNVALSHRKYLVKERLKHNRWFSEWISFRVFALRYRTDYMYAALRNYKTFPSLQAIGLRCL